MRLFSYVVEHDQGFAPNPFYGFCTLANCKPLIRQTASVGDLVVGTGSATAGRTGHLIFWMRIAEIMSFDEYWADPRFQRKKPVMNGSRMQRFGDNIYCTAPDGTILQADSFHSREGGLLSEENLRIDTGRTHRVLIGADFAYYGTAAPAIPAGLGFLVKQGPGHKCRFTQAEVESVTVWLNGLAEPKLAGLPCRW